MGETDNYGIEQIKAYEAGILARKKQQERETVEGSIKKVVVTARIICGLVLLSSIVCMFTVPMDTLIKIFILSVLNLCAATLAERIIRDIKEKKYLICPYCGVFDGDLKPTSLIGKAFGDTLKHPGGTANFHCVQCSYEFQAELSPLQYESYRRKEELALR